MREGEVWTPINVYTAFWHFGSIFSPILAIANEFCQGNTYFFSPSFQDPNPDSNVIRVGSSKWVCGSGVSHFDLYPTIFVVVVVENKKESEVLFESKKSEAKRY